MPKSTAWNVKHETITESAALPPMDVQKLRTFVKEVEKRVNADSARREDGLKRMKMLALAMEETLQKLD